MATQFMFSKKWALPPKNNAPRNEGKTMVTITTLTQDLTSPEFLLSIIHPKTCYQLIPACPQTLAYYP